MSWLFLEFKGYMRNSLPKDECETPSDTAYKRQATGARAECPVRRHAIRRCTSALDFPTSRKRFEVLWERMKMRCGAWGCGMGKQIQLYVKCKLVLINICAPTKKNPWYPIKRTAYDNYGYFKAECVIQFLFNLMQHFWNAWGADVNKRKTEGKTRKTTYKTYCEKYKYPLMPYADVDELIPYSDAAVYGLPYYALNT